MYYGLPLSDARHTTYGRVGGELCRLHRIPTTGMLDFSTTVRAEWLPDQPGADRKRAESLGLVGRDVPPSGPMVDIERVDQAFVNSEDEPGEPWSHSPPPAASEEVAEPDARPDVLSGFCAAVAASAELMFMSVSLECKALGTRLEVVGKVSTQRGGVHWVPPSEIVEWFRRLRCTDYSPTKGPWTTARFRFSAGGGALEESEFGYDQPAWDYVRPEPERFRENYDELRYFPRHQRGATDWLVDGARKHWGHLLENRDQQPSRSSDIRMAGDVFDGDDADGKPVTYRPALPRAEKSLVLNYLRQSRTAVEDEATKADVLDPQLPPQVPLGFVTDGVWMWPVATDYYLDVHNVPPPRDLLDHIRGRRYQAPDLVSDNLVERARALVAELDPESRRTRQVLDTVLRQAGELRISKAFYSFGRPVEGGYTLLREHNGRWTVFHTYQGSRQNENQFADVLDAAAYLIGCLSLARYRLRRPDSEPLDDYECPIRPLHGEPPLDAYEGKVLTSLQRGEELDRFGPPEGNTVFGAGTTLPQRSLPPDEKPGEYNRYRVAVDFEVVSGVARPGHGQVGGGRAYILPHAVRELVLRGWLTRLRPRTRRVFGTRRTDQQNP